MQQAWLQTEAGVEQTEVCRSPGCSCTHDTNFIHIDTKVDFSRNVLRQRERVEWHVGGGQGIGERSSEGGGRKGGGQSVGQGGRTGQQELGLGKQGELGVAAPPPCSVHRDMLGASRMARDGGQGTPAGEGTGCDNCP